MGIRVKDMLDVYWLVKGVLFISESTYRINHLKQMFYSRAG